MKQVVISCCLAAALLMAFQAMPSYAQYDQYDIYVHDWLAGTTVQVTSIPNRGEFNPAWSPDGRYIVHDVVKFDRSGTPVYQDLAITEVASGVSTPLAGTDQGNDAAWHPKGGLIAFDRAPVGDLSIYYVPSSGGTRGLLLTDAIDPTWSRNGNYLAFYRPSEGAIYTLNLKTGATTFVDEGEAPFWDQHTDEYITFTRDGEVFSVRVIGGAAAGSPMQQTFDPAFDGGSTYSPTAKHIVFMTTRGGQSDLWVVYAFGGTPTYLTGSPLVDEYDPAGRR
ncbi:MAG TPA: hypothetical protein VKP65_17805, partial [Rhodothermales bacterium]|nr:hypothetical protein [Rhodothermales bacterium]